MSRQRRHLEKFHRNMSFIHDGCVGIGCIQSVDWTTGLTFYLENGRNALLSTLCNQQTADARCKSAVRQAPSVVNTYLRLLHCVLTNHIPLTQAYYRLVPRPSSSCEGLATPDYEHTAPTIERLPMW